jgi:eukaryotic-like serine/threonine-protein kinase
VYAAVDAGDAPVALKVVHGEYAHDQDFRARFAREVDLLRRVTARCVPDFRGADTAARRPWLATEYVPGLTLRRHVSERGVFSGELLMGLAAGMAEGLAAIHAAGVVHRDLKPGNVIVAPDGPKVLDFGIARALEETAITRTGGLVGTPGWIAPEQYQGVEVTSAIDLFAWGGLVAFAATGRNPFGTGAPDALAYRTMEEEPDLDGLPEPLLGLVRAALNKDPASRPTAGQALSEVTRIWTGQAPADTDEATRVLPTMLDAHWSGAVTEDTDTSGWSVHAPPKPSLWRSRAVLVPAAAVLALALVGVIGAAAWQVFAPGEDEQAAPGGDANNGDGNGGAEPGGDDSGVEPPDLGHGGPALGVEAPSPPVDVSWASARYAWEGEHEGSLMLIVAEGDPGNLDRGIPVLAIDYLSAESEDGGVRFTGEAEYLLDEDNFVLHAEDFQGRDVLGQEYATDPEDALPVEEEGILAVLTPEEPSAEFTLTVGGAEAQGGIQYLTPELWGYQPEVPDNPVTGLMCYDTEGAETFTGPAEHLACEPLAGM